MKFKVGDRVRLVKISESEQKSIYGKEYINALNKIFTIKNIYDDNWARLKEANISPYLSDLELISEKFTKSDLKDGDIVTYRNGEKRTRIAGKLFDENGTATMWLHSYNEDLIREYKEREETDIIKVERPTGYETVFERREEILDETEKRYLRDVIRPFRKQVIEIIKWKYTGRDEYFIKIRLENGDILKFPDFTDKTMYKGMLADNSYTLEQLGL